MTTRSKAVFFLPTEASQSSVGIVRVCGDSSELREKMNHVCRWMCVGGQAMTLCWFSSFPSVVIIKLECICMFTCDYIMHLYDVAFNLTLSADLRVFAGGEGSSDTTH